MHQAVTAYIKLCMPEGVQATVFVQGHCAAEEHFQSPAAGPMSRCAGSTREMQGG